MGELWPWQQAGDGDNDEHLVNFFHMKSCQASCGSRDPGDWDKKGAAGGELCTVSLFSGADVVKESFTKPALTGICVPGLCSGARAQMFSCPQGFTVQ